MKKPAKSEPSPQVFEVHVSLRGTDPLVWRRFLVHDFISFSTLHSIIQLGMGWRGSHLYLFKVENQTLTERSMAKELRAKSSDSSTLGQILKEGSTFTYTYDLGDEWIHDIKINRVLPSHEGFNYPVCTGGENACPPEDCGGIHGFEELKETLAGPDSEEKIELLEWLGGYYDPFTFDPNFLNNFVFWSADSNDDELR